MASGFLSDRPAYLEIRDARIDGALLAAVRECVARERAAVAGGAAAYSADPRAAAEAVSEATLERLLASGKMVSGFASERDLTNAIPFAVPKVSFGVRDRGVATARRALDRAMAERLPEILDPAGGAVLLRAGHYWYPPGSYMGWHTNHRYPGWRLYLTYAEEPARSFFRYRDPRSGAVVTSLDDRFTLRLFEVRADRALWHAVHSDTDRFSFGYVVRPPTLRNRVARGMRELPLLGRF